MKITGKSVLLLTGMAFLAGCYSELYTRKELRTQNVPPALKNKTWTLRKISSEKILSSSLTSGFNESKGTSNCQFTFRFSDKGELLMSFKENTFRGTYLVDGNRFKYIFCGWREKIVWTSDPECAINPTQLAYVLHGEFQYSLEEKVLKLKNIRGDSFELD